MTTNVRVFGAVSGVEKQAFLVLKIQKSRRSAIVLDTDI